MNQRHSTRVAARDAFLLDTRLPMQMNLTQAYDIVHLALRDEFVRQWIPQASALAGRRISCTSGWGSALSAFLAQLTPESMLRAPLPARLIFDHIGVLLALAANDANGGGVEVSRKRQPARDRIRSRIAECCTDTAITAPEVAKSLHMSTRTLHRSLAAHGETFGETLIAARVQAALRMLRSPLFKGSTVAEIGYRAGFLDASHFARVLRRRVGMTPLQIRRDTHGDSLP
jgi:AraC-like DNA-binding protein